MPMVHDDGLKLCVSYKYAYLEHMIAHKKRRILHTFTATVTIDRPFSRDSKKQRLASSAVTCGTALGMTFVTAKYCEPMQDKLSILHLE